MADDPVGTLAFAEASQRLQLALAAGHFGEWSWDPATDLVTFGPRGASIFGIDPDEPVTWAQLQNLLYEEDREPVRLVVERALAEKSDYRIEYRIHRPNGESAWIAAQGRGVYADDGDVKAMIGLVRDVTASKVSDDLSQRFAAIVESSEDAIISKTLDGVITTWNAAAERIFGYTAAEAIGQSILTLIPQERHHEEQEILLRLRLGERIEHFETVRVHKDGTLLDISLSVSPVKDEHGAIVGAAKIARDVTEQKRMARALREETNALEVINKTGVMLASTLELNRLLQTITDAGTELSGAEFGAFFYNVQQESGESYMLYTLSGAPREAFEKFGHPRATPLFGPTFRGEKPIRIADVLTDPRYGQMPPHYGMPAGHLPVRSYMALPVISRTGEVIGGLFFGHSEPKKFSERSERILSNVAAQAAVAIDNARLYETVKRAAEEREQLLEAERAARAQAERMNLMKDEFLATLSHELRTPLNAILGWSQILRLSGVSSSDLHEGAEAIERNARVQTQLIEDLLDMSRIVSGKIRLDVQWTDLAAVVEAAVDSVRHSAEAKGIRLRKVVDSLAGPVAGDPTRLQQVVWNLLTNAIKFTPKGGNVDVTLERVNSHLEITVRDSGVGIKPELLPVIFERFRQADSSTTRAYSGLGLGLSIVKQLVELHGGTVQAESRGEGHGATFTVMLPLAPLRDGQLREHPAAPKPVSWESDSLDLSGLKVLLVDDESDARTLINRVLRQCRAEVIMASSAAEGLARIKEERPDVLISDIGMPQVDGYQFLRQVRALPPEEGGKTPAIALTAFARSEDRTRAMMAGFQVHIAKPIEARELLATVCSLGGRTGSTPPGGG